MGMMSRMATIVKSKMNRVLDNIEDPRETLDYSYEKQLELLRNVKRGVVEMVTAKRRLEMQASKVQANLTKLDSLARQALEEGREDLSRLALERMQAAVMELQGLDQQVADMEIEQEKLTNAEKRLQAKVQAFCTKKEVIKAQYNAAQARSRPSSRAYDFIRMAAISRGDLCLVGSHAGVSIGEDGPSQMGLEDIAAMRAVHGSTVLYPSDANQAAKLLPQMADRKGIVYMRTTREPLPVLYGPDEEFAIGGSHVVRSSDGDAVTIVAAGITVHEALKAADSLEQEGIGARVIDLYSIKPIDAATLESAAADTGLMVTAEDHWREGGLGEAVLSVFAESDERPRIRVLAVRDMPSSGTPADLLNAAGIDAAHIAAAACDLVAGRPA